MLYLDHAATTPMRPEVWDAMGPYATERFGNPSGSHAVSRAAKNALEEARERVATVLGCSPAEIVFTGGGTEADDLAIKGPALAGDRDGVVTVATEHDAVLESAAFLARQGHPVTVVDVGSDGRVDPERLADAVDDRTAVVSVMYANNETGVMHPLADVVSAVRSRSNAALHTDAVQAFVSEDVDVGRLGVDLLSLAAHKFGGPKGVGVLYVRHGVRLEPLIHGGGQELGRRSGTHNVMGAIGLATAIEMAAADRVRFRDDVASARGAFETLLAGRALRTVSPDCTLVQHSHLRFPGYRNETLLVRLDREGVAASAASACQSGAATVSHVLVAMGLSAEDARSSLRFSFGWTSRPEDGSLAADAVIAALDGAP